MLHVGSGFRQDPELGLVDSQGRQRLEAASQPIRRREGDDGGGGGRNGGSGGKQHIEIMLLPYKPEGDNTKRRLGLENDPRTGAGNAPFKQTSIVDWLYQTRERVRRKRFDVVVFIEVGMDYPVSQRTADACLGHMFLPSFLPSFFHFFLPHTFLYSFSRSISQSVKQSFSLSFIYLLIRSFISSLVPGFLAIIRCTC